MANKGGWGGARENCGRRSVYRGKVHNPLNVRVTHESDARLNALRQYWDISIGDMVEHLLWEAHVTEFESRPKPPLGVPKSHQLTFRLSVAAAARLRQIKRQFKVSAGDVVEALILNVPGDHIFPVKRRAA